MMLSVNLCMVAALLAGAFISAACMENKRTAGDAPVLIEKPVSNLFEPVKGILSVRCTPCHFPGGKMYEKLPFDNPQIVYEHKEGIVGRLKSDSDRQILENFLQNYH